MSALPGTFSLFYCFFFSLFIGEIADECDAVVVFVADAEEEGVFIRQNVKVDLTQREVRRP